MGRPKSIKALEIAGPAQSREMKMLMDNDAPGKVDAMLNIFRECGVDRWAVELKEKYVNEAFKHLEDIAVVSVRKEPLKQLAEFLIQREH